MELKEAIAGLPASSPFRKVLPGLMSANDETRDKALERLGRITDKPRAIAKTEARGLLRAAVGLRFPPQQFDWNDTAHDLIFPLVTSPHKELIPIARDGYAGLSGQARSAVLALLGAIGTRDAATAFMSCVRQHGWPRVYPRVFTELTNLYKHGDLLFPELVELAGPNIGGVTDALMGALSSGKLDPSRVKLERIAPLVTKSLRTLLARATKLQQAKGTRWRYSERYFAVRQQAGAWLDLAGYLRSKSVEPLLRKALRLRDPRLVLFAATSLLRRGARVDAKVLEAIAASNECREMLFSKLDGLGKVTLFPAKYRTWPAFAEAAMVDWLLFPSELGHEPDDIKQMSVIRASGRTLYVWSFRDGKKWMAGVSGPFGERGKPRPQHGHLTFSRFDEWKKAPEDHAEDIVKTLVAWQKQ